MIETIWTFRVKSEERREFERHYAPDGSWAKLFQQATGFMGTRLLRDLADPDRFVTVDTWESADAMEKFKDQYAREYHQLDRQCSDFTVDEQPLGVFECIDRWG